jgi:tetratricopeptide (TPR) repeat protein
MSRAKTGSTPSLRGEQNRSPSDPATRTTIKLGAYLRRLREGYGYTLRKVEERALAFGETIDNSQLSRFEKGKAVPSFEKLRALARVFNVSVQNFSDILDLEQYEVHKPGSDDFEGLLQTGASLAARGEHGRAFVTFERALEVAEDTDSRARETIEKVIEARWRMASALRRLGKLALAENVLRDILKHHRHLSVATRVRSLLQLSYVYSGVGDRYLASVLARECLELATAEGDLKTQASVLNALANVRFHDGDYEEAHASYQRAFEILESLDGHEEMRTTLLINLGGCIVSLGRFDEGIAAIEEAHRRAVDKGFRRAAALALTRMAEAYQQNGEFDRARQGFSQSDTLAGRPEESYQDILFLNTYRCWEMARHEGNATREKIAFGRLRHLRSLVERRFHEVDEFDRYIERTRRKHEQAT